MRRLRLVILATLSLMCLAGGISGCQDDTGADEASKSKDSGSARAGGAIDLAVLYVGQPGSEREDDFRKFLSAHFSRVGTTDGAAFDGTQSSGFDVTILDCNAPKMPADFARPVVTVGLDGMRYFAGRIRFGCFR